MMALSFGQWKDGSRDAVDMLYLLQIDEIWEPQARDGDEKEKAKAASFPGAWLALCREDDQPYGYILYVPRNPYGSVLEQHTAFLPHARGRQGMDAIGQATAAVFLKTPCSRIVTFCPGWLPGAEQLARRMGGMPLYHVANFASKGGKKWGATLYGQGVLDWAFRNHGNFVSIGEQWHEQVFAQLEPHHEDDPSHNGFVGLAVEMGKAQPHKAVAVYNTWAELAGYAQAEVLWTDGAGNAVIDISSAIVVNNGSRAAAAFPKCPPSQPSAQ